MAEQLNFEQVFGPNREYHYFKHAKTAPFRHNATSFEMVNAGWCADASLLAYVNDENFVVNTLKDNAGLEATCMGFERTGSHGTQYFIAHNAEFVIVCFRGTEISEKEDVLIDAQWNLVESGQGGRVHNGFMKALNSVWEELCGLLRALENGRRIWFTGHSLGAALATLAADRYSPTKGLYTFGSPRVGDKGFKEGFHVKAYRFVNNNDLVTRIPPPGLFEHVGRLFYIDRNGEIHENPKLREMQIDRTVGAISHLLSTAVKWGEGHFDAIGWDDLRDHGPTFYAEYIWAKV